MIRVHNLHKSFRSGWAWWRQEHPVLKGFDFEAYPGQVTGVVGPNGAGKTTLFRILCGLEVATSGEVEIDGINPWTHPDALRGRIALLPEDPGIGPTTTGHQHLWMFGAMMGLDRAGVKQAMADANDFLALSSFWHTPFRRCSRGQRARISLARMRMMPEAKVLIFDEPSNGLDFEAVTRLHRFIRQLASEGRTILVASHILSDLKHLCDRMVGVADGKAASPEMLSAWLDAHARSQELQTTDLVS